MPAMAPTYTDAAKIIEVLIGTITFMVVISYVFKETAVYRMVNHIVLGVATGIAIMITWRDIVHPNWWLPVSQGFASIGEGSWNWNVLWVLCLVPGAMWYTLYFKKLAWMSRIVFGLFIGMGAGLAFKNYLLLIVPQITQSFKPLVAMRDGAFDWGATIKNLLFTATLMSVLVYFFFTFRREIRPVNHARLYGRWMMMICFGALFGYTVMTRMSYFLERLNYVKEELLRGVFGL